MTDAFNLGKLAKAWSTPTKWYPIPIALGAVVLLAVKLRKEQRGEDLYEVESQREGAVVTKKKVDGPWQVGLSSTNEGHLADRPIFSFDFIVSFYLSLTTYYYTSFRPIVGYATYIIPTPTGQSPRCSTPPIPLTIMGVPKWISPSGLV